MATVHKQVPWSRSKRRGSLVTAIVRARKIDSAA